MAEPYGPDSSVTLPPRGLEYVRPVVHDGHPALDILCDCGAAALVVIDCNEPYEHLDGTEQPYTCPGCMSVTWLTLRFQATPQEPQPDSPAGS